MKIKNPQTLSNVSWRGVGVVGQNSPGLCEDRPHLQTPIILNSLPQILFFILVQLLLAHKSLFGKKKKTKQNRKPVHHKIISRIGLQSRAFVPVLLEKNLHMNNMLKQGLDISSFFALSLIYKYLLGNVPKGKKLTRFL